MPTLIHRRVREARDGRNPTVITRLKSGWVVAGDHQVVPGYCLLLPDPVVPSINDLGQEERRAFLDDMLAIGDALLEITDAHRINYELLGNGERALHAHVSPRYEWEGAEVRRRPIWFYDRSEAPKFDPVGDAEFMDRMRRCLQRADQPS